MEGELSTAAAAGLTLGIVALLCAGFVAGYEVAYGRAWDWYARKMQGDDQRR